MLYHVKAGIQAKIARPGQSAQDYTTTVDQTFTEDELIAAWDRGPSWNPDADHWAAHGYYVFRWDDMYLIVEQFNIDIDD